MKQLEVYFRQYLLNVRKLKETSVEHYTQALRTVSRYLRDAKLITGDVYSVDKLDDLKGLRLALKGDPAFVDQDETGNRMYSAGFNRYIEFAELSQANGAAGMPVDLGLMDVEVEKPDKKPKVSYGWNRDRVIVEQVLKADKYLCEIDANHKTFVTRRNDQMYLEGHHLIPISRQDEFEKSLDVYANIIGLCPNCHRQLHFGKKSEVKNILRGLYDLRAERLVKSGIEVSKDEFLALAVG